MADVRPFRALRYNPARVPDLGRVIAPPYDIIGPAEQDRLHAASPHNIVRLTLAKPGESESAGDNRYTRARAAFDAWRRDAVLRQDPEPAFYVVEQMFAAEGHVQARLGFIGLLGLEEPIERSVLRHEATLAGPKEDRTRLLAALPANLEPIFCVYPDDGGALQALLRGAAVGPPAFSAEWNGGVVRGWVVTDPAFLRQVSARAAQTRLLIADGHHRFEVAHANRHRYGALMAFFVSMADPGLRVRPIHRVAAVGPRPGLAEALKTLGAVAMAGKAEGALAWLDDQPSAALGRFGCLLPEGAAKLALSQETLEAWLRAPDVPAPLAGLDVTLLQRVVLPRLGIPEAAITYTADPSDASQAVAAGRAACAFLLRRIPLDQVYALAEQGLRLAPKSTYFTPKIPSGLALHPLV